MSTLAEICKLPAPVLAVIHHEDGNISYRFAATLYQARQEAQRAGATSISDALWDDLELSTIAEASSTG